MKFEVRDEMIELSKENYAHVLPLLKNLAYEPVFAYSVIERNQSGKVFVDHNENPTCSNDRSKPVIKLLLDENTWEV
ncbi:hypothetical protein NYE25_08345 [Paenibacillus sp. FSL E2-8871]|uniref:hypothetical protein n=1 Tax=Paenibacillus sp. FSL E2-8871 TaxID=2975326 RepID=UPI0030F78F67